MQHEATLTLYILLLSSSPLGRRRRWLWRWRWRRRRRRSLTSASTASPTPAGDRCAATSRTSADERASPWLSASSASSAASSPPPPCPLPALILGCESHVRLLYLCNYLGFPSMAGCRRLGLLQVCHFYLGCLPDSPFYIFSIPPL